MILNMQFIRWWWWCADGLFFHHLIIFFLLPAMIMKWKYDNVDGQQSEYAFSGSQRPEFEHTFALACETRVCTKKTNICRNSRRDKNYYITDFNARFDKQKCSNSHAQICHCSRCALRGKPVFRLYICSCSVSIYVWLPAYLWTAAIS